MNLPGHSEHCRCCTCDPSHATARQPLLHLCNVSFKREKRVILSNVNFTVDKGDFIAITGPNGGGKTTLLRLILGLLKPTEGNIVFCDENGNSSMPPSIGYLPQKNSVDSHFPITVHGVVSSGLLAQKNMDKAAVATRVAELRDTCSRPSLPGLSHVGLNCSSLTNLFHILIRYLRNGSTGSSPISLKTRQYFLSVMR